MAHLIAVQDFPWEGLDEALAQAFKSNNINLIYGALCLILQIARVFEFKMNEKRIPLNVFMNKFATTIQELLGILLRDIRQEAYHYINVVLQIYWTATYLDFPDGFVVNGQFGKWLAHFYLILQLEMGELEDPALYQEVTEPVVPAWTTKQLAAQILFKMFHRYNDPSYLRPRY